MDKSKTKETSIVVVPVGDDGSDDAWMYVHT